jgi:hypothetical protein
VSFPSSERLQSIAHFLQAVADMDAENGGIAGVRILTRGAAAPLKERAGQENR